MKGNDLAGGEVLLVLLAEEGGPVWGGEQALGLWKVNECPAFGWKVSVSKCGGEQDGPSCRLFETEP
jgi:hypothetical protein